LFLFFHGTLIALFLDARSDCPDRDLFVANYDLGFTTEFFEPACQFSAEAMLPENVGRDMKADGFPKSA
jgi:hypothetical protein